MPTYAVLLIGAEGSIGGREGLRVVAASDPRTALAAAHENPPSRDVKHAWIHELVGTATLVDVVVDAPKWGRVREAVSA